MLFKIRTVNQYFSDMNHLKILFYFVRKKIGMFQTLLKSEKSLNNNSNFFMQSFLRYEIIGSALYSIDRALMSYDQAYSPFQPWANFMIPLFTQRIQFHS